MSTDEASPSASQEATPDGFDTMLINFFKPYVEMNNPIDETDCIRRSLEIFSEHLNCKQNVDVYLEVIFSVFECLRSTNSDLIQNALAEYNMRKMEEYEIIKELEFKPPSLLTPFPIHEVVYSLGTEDNKHLRIDSILFYQPFLFQDLEVVQRLLRYGVPFGIEDIDMNFFLDTSLRCLVDNYLPSPYTEETFSVHFNEERYINLTASHKTSTSRRRLYFYLLGTMAVIIKQEKNSLMIHKIYEIFIKSFKLVFETIPDPLLHVGEIWRFLNLVIDDENKHDVIKEYCRVFATEFPTSMMPLQPRSLMHLSRCRVRDCLIKTRKLPHGVWSFEIPDGMKNYILVQDRVDEYHPKYVSALTEGKAMRNSKRKRTLSSD